MKAINERHILIFKYISIYSLIIILILVFLFSNKNTIEESVSIISNEHLSSENIVVYECSTISGGKY